MDCALGRRFGIALNSHDFRAGLLLAGCLGLTNHSAMHIAVPQTDLHRTPLAWTRWARIVLLTVLGYEGLGGLAGGGMLISEPGGRLMDMPVGMMHGVFPDFLIPGIILLLLGVLNVIAFFSVLRHTKRAWVAATLACVGFTIWFWVEIAVLQEVHWLHFMWGLPVLASDAALVSILPLTREGGRKLLLWSGVLASALYVVINLIIAAQWPAYDVATQTISELSAIGAPTRALWMVLCTPYSVLMIAFAYGVRMSAGDNRKLRIAGSLLIAYGALGIFWPFAPMHLRETLAAGGGTISDTMHLTLAAITQVIYLVALGYTAFALSRAFRNYSIATFLTLLLFGALTFIEAPGVSANTPTPHIGIWERINIGVFMAWVVVLAVELLPSRRHEVR